MPMPKTKHSMISSFAPEYSASQRQLLVDPEQYPKRLHCGRDNKGDGLHPELE